MKPYIQIALVFLLTAILSFFVSAGILWLIFYLFNVNWWSWRVALGCWLIGILLSSVFNTHINVGR